MPVGPSWHKLLGGWAWRRDRAPGRMRAGRPGLTALLALVVVAGCAQVPRTAGAPTTTPVPASSALPAPPLAPNPVPAVSKEPPAPAPPPVVVAAPAPPPPTSQGPTPPLGTRGAAPPQFPWPPPRASAEFQLPRKWLPAAPNLHLADVADALKEALGAAGYPRWSHLMVPNGFALVCQMEQIRADGVPSPVPARWSTRMPPAARMSVLEFIKALANAQPGHYRVIVFVATDQPWQRGAASPTGQQAERWLAEGLSDLPPDLGRQPYGEAHRTTALIYEFVKASQNDAAVLVENSSMPARQHLDRAGIADALLR